MSNNFNFGGFEGKSAINNSSALKPWNIYDVKFNGADKEELKGKDSTVYQTVKINFTGADGKFSKNLFIPKETPEDMERPECENKEGHKYQRPSRFEEFKWKLLQLAQVINQDGFEKLQKIANKIKTMDQFIDAILKIVNEKKGVETKLKLTGRNSNGTIYADIPNVAAINHDGELFISNNFVGSRVAFSSYEAQQAAAYSATKPTTMGTESPINKLGTPNVQPESDEIDFDSLAATL